MARRPPSSELLRANVRTTHALLFDPQRTNHIQRYPTGTAGVTIGTHNGTFHADEALACYLLKLLPEYA